jgi:hypothetical protein
MDHVQYQYNAAWFDPMNDGVIAAGKASQARA